MKELYLLLFLLSLNISSVFSAVTEELRIKGVVLKIASEATLTTSGSTVSINNTNSGLVKVQTDGVIIADGDVNNLSGSSYQIDGLLQIKGNWINDATASVALVGAASGMVEFNGSINQNIGGAVTTIFENFSIDNSTGVTLITNQTISTGLSFTDGIITTGANRLDITAPTDGMSGFGPGKYVFGNFRRYVTAGIEYNFPIGTATQFELAGMYINSVSGLSYIDVAFTISDENPVPAGLMVDGEDVDEFLDYGYWKFTPNALPTNINYNVTIQSTGHTDKGGTQDNYAVITDIAGGWEDLGIHSNATQQYTPTTVLAKRQALTTLGGYIVAYLGSDLYIQPAVTDELRVKGLIFNVSDAATATTSGSSVAINNSNSGIIKVQADGLLAADGDVNNLSSSSYQIDGLLQVKGDWTNNATASVALAGAVNGTIEFNGTANQNIGGAVTTIFENFSIDNSAGVTLTTNQTISTGLSFTDGIITTGANRLDITAPTDGMSGFGPGKYVFGNFRRYVSQGIEYNFPIGTATQFELAGMYINSVTGLSYVDVGFTVSDENPVPAGLMVNGEDVDEFLDYGYWTFTPNIVPTSINYNVTIQSTGHTDKGGNQDNYAVITDIGAGWQNLGVHSNATQQYSPTTVLAKRQVLTTFGDYIIAYLDDDLYMQPTITEELRIKGLIFNVPGTATATTSGSSVAINNTNSGIVKIQTDGVITTDGDVNNLSSSSYQVDGLLQIKGNWINDATASVALAGAANGTIEFNGTANQNIGGAVTTIFENFSIDNSAGVTLTTNQTISTGLSFTDGIITTGANRLDITAPTDGMSGFGPGKYVFGNFRRYVSQGIEYNFPIGTATQFELAGMYINSVTGLSYVDVGFTVSDENPVPAGLMVNGEDVDEFLDYGYWTFTPNIVPTSINYNVTIQSTGHTDKGGNQDNYAVITDIGAGWQNLGVHSNATQQYSPTTVLAKRQVLTTFGDYIIAYLDDDLYMQPTITEELRIKGLIFNVPGTATATTSGSSVAINNTNSGIVKIQTDGVITTDGDVNNLSSSSYQVDGLLQIKGNWINDATASVALAGAANGTIEFNGTANQNIGGAVTTIFENFSIDNSAGVTLTTNQTISTGLSFTDGIITTGANRLDITAPTDGMSGFGPGKYVFGNFRRYVSQGIEYNFPIGTATQFELAGMYINSVTGLSYVDVGFTVSDENPVPAGLMVNGEDVDEFLDYGYWTFTPNIVPTSINYNVTIQSTGHTDKGGTQDNYAVITDIGADWQDLGSHSNVTQNYTPTTVLASRQILTTLGSYIIAYLSDELYTQPLITEELRVKGLTFQVAENATTTTSGSTVSINNTNSGIIKIQTDGMITADGDVNNLSSSSYQIDGLLQIKGNWINDATASVALAGAASGMVEFNGSANQNIGGAVTTIFENFSIDNSTGVTLTTNQTISTGLSFTDGIITTGANRLDITAPTDGMSGFGPGKYVFGNFRRYVTAGIEYNFPIGTATQFELAGMYINSVSGLSYIDVAFTISDENPVPAGLMVDGEDVDEFLDYGYWKFTPNALPTNINYNVTIQSTGHTDKGGNQDNYAVITDIGAGWQDLGSHSHVTQNYTPTTVLASRQILTTLGSYIIAYLSDELYIQPTINNEVFINRNVLRIETSTNLLAAGINADLLIENGGILKVETGGQIEIEGNITNDVGSSIQTNGLIIANKDFINNGTGSLVLAGGTTGSLQFEGLGANQIRGTSPTILENLTMNNTVGNLTMAHKLVVSNQLTLNNGIIITGSDTLFCTSTSAAHITGHSANSFIYGTLYKAITTNTNIYALPIGKDATSNDYHLAEFLNNNLTGVSALTASVASIIEAGAEVDDSLDNSKAIQGGVALEFIQETAEWTINPTGTVTGGNYGINLYVANIAGLTAAENDQFAIVKRPSSSTRYFDWDAFSYTTNVPEGGNPGRVYNGGNGFAQRTGYTSFSNFAIAKTLNMPLPIELLYFNATAIDRSVKLDWATALEINNDYFTIERSTNGYDFVEIATIAAVGNSTEINKYSDFDYEPEDGYNYYRLKQTDYDGSYSYSHIRVVEFIADDNFSANGGILNIYPNPVAFDQNVNLMLSNFGHGENVNIIIEDITAKTVLETKLTMSEKGSAYLEISFKQALAKGMYTVIANDGKNLYTKKLVVY